MFPTLGITFTIMGVACVVIFLWNHWSAKEVGMTTEEIIAESRRKHDLDV